ncbi:MAG: anthrone oxygenase family protein [Acidobacteriota bacterium]
MATVDDLIFALTMFAALGCGLIAGVFFAFSAFVMKALARLAPREGIAAMQAINIAVINPLFLGVFLGTAAACAFVIISSLLRWRAGAVYSIIGATLYLVGSLMVTIFFNVPKNNALARVAPDEADSAGLWDRYVAEWTAWNHVRAVASIAAAAAFIIGMAAR